MEGVSSRKILVGFNSAVSSRYEKGLTAPFFSFFGVSNILGVPLVSVSDPSMALSENISMGWYLGNDALGSLPKKIAALLDSIALHFDAELILIGGSCGGFAALKISESLASAAKVVAWNPQMDISLYFKKHVEEYLDHCFYDFEYKGSDFLSSARYFLSSKGIDYKVNLKNINSDKEVYVFQNLTDWHMDVHFLPVFKSFSDNYFNPYNYVFIKDNVLFYLDNWGRGHSPFPQKNILTVVRSLFDSKSMSSVVDHLDFLNIDDVDISDRDVYLWYSSIEKNGDLYSISSTHKDSLELYYAFYFMSSKGVVKKIPYNRDSVGLFLNEDDASEIYGYAFVRTLGGIRYTRPVFLK